MAAKEQIIICSPVSGRTMDLADVNEPAFSSEALGKGIAIVPDCDTIYCPISGRVTALFDSKHAIGIIDENGVEVLIHIGIDTVNLKGKYFRSFVKQGDFVQAGTKMIEFSRKKIAKKGYDTVVIEIVTNSNEFDVVAVSPMQIEAMEDVIYVCRK